MELSIRAATTADHPALAAIFRAASLSNDGDREQLLAEPELLELDPDWLEASDVRVATVDGRVVGFASARRTGGSVAELDDLFVDPAWMRRGVARALMAATVARVKESGVTRLEVSANHHAVPFYEAIGFVVDGVVDTRFGPTPRMVLGLG
jgi:GNAT superfamily N-acetyltransferase